MYQAGWSQRAIAAHLGRHPKTIRRWLRLDPQTVGLLTRRRRQRLLELYQPYILERWNAGCRNAVQLLRELQPLGYRGQLTIWRAYLANLRRTQGLPARVQRIPGGAMLLPPRPAWPSVRTIAGLCIKPTTTLRTDGQHALAAVQAINPVIARVVTLAHAFADLVRDRQADRLDEWLAQAEQSGNIALKNFAWGCAKMGLQYAMHSDFPIPMAPSKAPSTG